MCEDKETIQQMISGINAWIMRIKENIAELEEVVSQLELKVA